MTDLYKQQMKLFNELKSIADIMQSERVKWAIYAWSGIVQNDIAYIKKDLTKEEFIETIRKYNTDNEYIYKNVLTTIETYKNQMRYVDFSSLLSDLARIKSEIDELLENALKV